MRRGYQSCSYTYDLAGNRTSETCNGQTITYGYEAGTSRLSSLTWQADDLAQCGGPQVAVTRGVSRDGLGRATSGYGTKYPLASDEYLVSYDAAGQLATAASGGAGLYEYGYDHRRLRVSKTGPEGSVRYVYDEGGRLLSEADGSGTREYVWLGGEALVLLEDLDNDPSTPSVAYLLATDQLGTPVRAYEASSGEAAWAADHEPFGRAWTYVPGSMQGPGLEVSLRYPGQVADAETGLHYNWHRYYDPETGRYLQPDPILGEAPDLVRNAQRDGHSGAWASYAYAENRPLVLTDANAYATWMCQKPLDALGGGNGTSSDRMSGPDFEGNPLFHQYTCIVVNGKTTCGGLTQRDGNPFGPGAPSKDMFYPDRCKKTDNNDVCLETCLQVEWMQDRPDYSILTYNCQNYARDVYNRCKQACSNP